MNIVKSGDTGRGRGWRVQVLTGLFRSWQLPRGSNFIGEAEWGRGGVLLAWPTTAASPQFTMEIHISDWTHKFQN
jgi:hypothetical protein